MDQHSQAPVSVHLDFNDPRVVLAQYPHWETAHPQKGESKVYVGASVPLGYLYLASAFYITEGTSKWYTDGQLVKVWKRQNGFAYLDEPIARTFHAPGILFNVPVEVGRTYTGSGLLAPTFAAEGLVRDWVTPDGWNAPKALDLQACTRMTVENVTIGKPADPMSYGIGIQQSHGITVKNVVTHGVRHPVIPWACARSTFSNIEHLEPTHDFDFGHGFCEDLVFANIKCGDRNGAVGNRWLAKCESITIANAKNARQLIVYSGSTVEVVHSRFSKLRPYRNHPVAMRIVSDWGSFSEIGSPEGGADAPVEVLIR